MSTPNRQIGWSQESNLLSYISKQLDKLNGTVAATAAGGLLNPTTDYIPYNSGLAFGDSFLVNDATNSVLKTVYSGNDVGLKLDFVNNEFYLGDPTGANASVIEMIGFNINITATQNNFSLKFDDNNSEIVSTSGGNDIGIKLNFNANEYLFGDFGNNLNGHSFQIDDGDEIIFTTGFGIQKGLILDFGNEKFTLGSTTEYIGIDTLNNTLIAGANLTSGTAGGASGQHLKININGTNYKIALLNN